MKYSPGFKNSFAQIVQMQVNVLVKEIEFYKMQHGQYPKELEDLRENNDLVSIVDPILLSNSVNGNLNYRYEKVGAGYKLYSVGVDLIDDTNDDIFPTLSKSDTTEIGFIEK